MPSFDARICPIFINCRDRVEDLRALVSWLERAGHENVKLLDNDSAWEPLLEYFEHCPYEVVHLGENLGSRAVWEAGLVPSDEFWVLTDPDVIPIEACPPDAVELLHELLCVGLSDGVKAGLGLYLEDTPEFHSKRWERGLVSPDRLVGTAKGAEVFSSLVDTSFALYYPGARHSLPGLRTGYPYQARHMPWYRIDEPTDEERFYLERAIVGPLGSSWAQGRQ